MEKKNEDNSAETVVAICNTIVFFPVQPMQAPVMSAETLRQAHNEVRTNVQKQLSPVEKK